MRTHNEFALHAKLQGFEIKMIDDIETAVVEFSDKDNETALKGMAAAQARKAKEMKSNG